ncbi:hypothetical protein CCHL11_09627 [Colletotrichum chlorophyti]|uniref:Uncharacterized protein n=1 Tax=Colletotrichum chlorophyti TaxID=708187 RepID=A0A1Q8S8G6_9PEZI|nr:hypothetical protein CCHL11_09627 [Colletotrichum chlorophyti]
MVFFQQFVYKQIDSACEREKPYRDSEEDDSHVYEPEIKVRSFRKLLVKSTLVIGVLVSAFLSGLVSSKVVNSHSHSPSSLLGRIPIPLTQCGNSPDEARSLGCRFEVHNFAWVPPECYDDELGDEWDSHNDWVWSRSPNNSADTDKHFVAECRAGNVRTAWLPWYQHMAHCDIIMKKYMRSVMLFRPMDNWTSNWPHYEHCSRMMSRFDMDPMFYNSQIGLKFPTCDYSWFDERPETAASIELQPPWHATADYVKAPYCNDDKKVVYDGIQYH